MAWIEGSIQIGRSLEDVWKYIARVENTPKWDEGVLDAQQTSDGPAGVGTNVQLTRQFFGRRWTVDRRTIEYEPNRYLVFRYTSGPYKDSVGRYTVASAGGGTRLTIADDIELRGSLRWASLLVLPMMHREAQTARANVKRILEAHD